MQIKNPFELGVVNDNWKRRAINNIISCLIIQLSLAAIYYYYNNVSAEMAGMFVMAGCIFTLFYTVTFFFKSDILDIAGIRKPAEPNKTKKNTDKNKQAHSLKEWIQYFINPYGNNQEAKQSYRNFFIIEIAVLPIFLLHISILLVLPYAFVFLALLELIRRQGKNRDIFWMILPLVTLIAMVIEYVLA